MKDSKLIRLLKTFSKDEWKEFEKFAASPYFNKGRNYLPLLKALKKFYPGFESDKLTKENIYLFVYPGKKYKETVINAVFSGLYKLAEEFLIQQNLRSHSFKKIPVLLRELSIKGLRSEVDNLINEIEKKFCTAELGYDDYFRKFMIYEEIYDHYFVNDERYRFQKAREKYSVYLFKKLLLELITTEKEHSFQKNFTKHDYKENIFGKILRSINFEQVICDMEINDPENTAIISIYYNVLMALKKPGNDDYYFKAKALIEKNYNRMDKDLKVRCYSNLEAISTEKVLLGRPEWQMETFRLLKKMVNEKLYIISGGGVYYFSKTLFRNIIMTGSTVNEIEWTEKFVTDYIDKTDPKFRNVLYHSSMARIEFLKKNYPAALMHIGKTEQNQITYKIDSRNILSKIYYETGAFESLFSLLDSYNHLLNNSKVVNVPLIKRHKEYVRVLKKILQIKTGYIHNVSFEQIKHRIARSKFINSKDWLLEKISELEKK